MTDLPSSAAAAPIEGIVICPSVISDCRCREPADHDGPCVCPCGGSWHFDADGEFCIDVFPDISLGAIPGLRFDDERW